jgi:hypothetical protein
VVHDHNPRDHDRVEREEDVPKGDIDAVGCEIFRNHCGGGLTEPAAA